MSIFFSVFYSFERDKKILLNNQELDYQRKNNFSNQIKKISTFSSLISESSITPYDLYEYDLFENDKKDIFDFDGIYDLVKQNDPIDLNSFQGIELKKMRSDNFVRKFRNLKKYKSIIVFLKDNPELIQLINNEMFRDFYAILITSNEMSNTFVNSLEDIFKSFLGQEKQQLMYTTIDTTRTLKLVSNLTDFVKILLYKEEIPESIKNKRLYRLLKFKLEIDKFFKSNELIIKNEIKGMKNSKNNVPYQMWERFQDPEDSTKNLLLPNIKQEIKLKENIDSEEITYKYDWETKDEANNIFNQLKDENSVINRYPEKIYKLISKQLLENSSKLFLYSMSTLILEISDIFTNIIKFKDKVLDISETRLKGLLYSLKTFLFLSKNEIYGNEIKQNKNLNDLLNNIINFFYKIDNDSWEFGIFKNKIKTILDSEKTLQTNQKKLKENIFFDILFSSHANSILIDKIISKFFSKNISTLLEENTEKIKAFLEGYEISSDNFKKFFDFFLSKKTEINQKLEDIREKASNFLGANIPKTTAEINTYIKKLTEFFEKIINYLIFLIESIINDESQNIFSLKWILNLTGIFFKQAGIFKDNFIDNIIFPLFRTITSFKDDKNILIQSLEFIKSFFNKIIFNRLLKVRLFFKDKLNWTNQKLSYCYLKSLTRDNFDKNVDCKNEEIDVEKPNFVLDENKEYKKGSPIEKNSPLAEIIDIIHKKKSNQKFNLFSNLVSKIFSFSGKVIPGVKKYIENEFYDNFEFYIDEKNWEFENLDKKWEEYKKNFNDEDKEFYTFSVVGKMVKNNIILYSYNFIYEIDLKNDILKIVKMEKLI